MVNVLISTYGFGIYRIVQNLPERKNDVTYFVSWQGQQSDFDKIPDLLKSRQDVFISTIIGKGLSRNRNNCIKLVKSHSAKGVFLIADDDVSFLSNFEYTIEEAFSVYPKAGIIAFKVQSNSSRPFKNYWKTPKSIGITDIDRISSIEIAGRMEILESLKFDERLGLGTDYPSGEEVAFLSDGIKKGVIIQFVPEYIVSHPYETSGKRRINQFSDEDLKLIGGRAYRVYGESRARLFFIFSAIKNFQKYRGSQTLFSYLKNLHRGMKLFKQLANE